MAIRRAELLDDLVAHTVEHLVDNGIAKDIAEQAANSLADRLVVNWAGQVIPFPMDHAYKLSLREHAVLEASKSMTIAALAMKFGYTERGIRGLLKRAQRRLIVDNQPDLF